jgi:hypothetical protein
MNSLDSCMFSTKASTIKQILEDLSNNKSTGYAGINNEMFKYASSDELINNDNLDVLLAV